MSEKNISIVITAIVTSLLVTLVWIFAGSRKQDSPGKSPDRFEKIDYYNEPGITHFRDIQTGKEYIRGYQGGMLEVEKSK